jgi:hypothetical protein
MKKLAVLLAMGVFLTTTAYADTFYLHGVNYPDITTTVNFSYNPADYTVSIDLTNTSSIASSLTSFAFNVPTNVTGVSAFSGPNSGWDYFFDRDGIDTPGQFGLFDIGAGTGPNFNGGSPNYGIWNTPPDNFGSFSLVLQGSDLGSLTTASFLSLLSDLDDKKGDPQYFIARYQAVGPDGEGSDVAIPNGVVPEPSTFVLLATGIAGVAFLSRRKKSA